MFSYMANLVPTVGRRSRSDRVAQPTGERRARSKFYAWDRLSDTKGTQVRSRRDSLTGWPPAACAALFPASTSEETASAVRRRVCCGPRRGLAETAPAEVSSGALSPLDLAATGARNLAAVKDAAAIVLLPLCLLCAGCSLSSAGRRAMQWTERAAEKWVAVAYKERRVAGWRAERTRMEGVLGKQRRQPRLGASPSQPWGVRLPV
jgi:hypothetical protein